MGIIGLIMGLLFIITFVYYLKWVKRMKVRMVEDEKMELNFQEIIEETILKFEQYKNDKEKKDWFKVRFFDYVHTDLIPKYFIPEKDFASTIHFYKLLLNEIKHKFEDNYLDIHKGVPFFFIGWYSFLMRKFDQSIFYLDAALAEDKKTHIVNDVWSSSGAVNFFKLNSEYTGIYERFNTKKLNELLRHLIDKFNIVSGCNITIEDFREEFVGKLLLEENTAIITTLYSFILESEDIQEMIELRSIYGGTIEPMIIHLFKGAIIFETLLKKTNKRPDGEDYRMLDKLFTLEDSPFPSKYPDFKKEGGHIEHLSEILKPIIENKYINNISTAFNTVYKIRNSTAHRLSWDDIFTSDNYSILFTQVIYSIFFVIYKEYVQ